MKNINDEIAHQDSFWFYFKAGCILYFLIPLLIGYNGHGGIAGVLLIVGAVSAWIIAEKALIEFAERLKAIKYKRQIENLYVVSAWPGDDTASASFMETLYNLRDYGNTHEVRVYLLMYQRPVIRWSFWNKDGKMVNNQIEREGIVVNETWEEFCQKAEQFRIEQNDKRRRELEAAPAWEWNEQFVYGQNFN
jgi:hypothetical protein